MSNSFWPNGKRMAVIFNVAYEAWSEGHTSGIGPMGNPLPSGVLDTQALSWGAYASKRGIWRLLEILARQGVRATVFTSACLAERAPESVRAIVEGGHEVCCHNYAQNILPVMLDETAEREEITRCVDLLSEVMGRRPVGWVSPRGTPSLQTPALLAEMGFRWFSDCFDDDAPYIATFGGHRIAAIPLAMEVNDLPLYMRHGNAPRVMLEVFTDTFRSLYHDTSFPAHMDVTVHAHVFSRPYGSWVYEEIMRFVKGYPDLWIATREEVAEWILNR